MSGKRSSGSVDLLDVAMMSGEMAKRYGGTIFFVASGYTGPRSAPLLTAWWNADALTDPNTHRIAGGGVSVECAVKGDALHGAPALMYRLLWELDAKVREELGDDLDW